MSTVWLQSAFVEAEEARLPAADRGFLLGDGVFDTFRIKDGRPRHLDAHLARLRASAAVFAIPLTYSDEEIAQAASALAERNGLDNALARLTLSRGPGPRGLVPPDPAEPLVLMALGPWLAPPDWLDLAVSQVRRAEHSLTAHHKTLSYLDCVEARRRAHAEGYGEALMLNGAGELACASAANLFWLSSGTLYTPALEAGALPGVTRARVLRLAAEQGLETREGHFAPSTLANAEAAFLTSSGLGAAPVRRIAGLRGEIDFDLDHPAFTALREAEAAD